MVVHAGNPWLGVVDDAERLVFIYIVIDIQVGDTLRMYE